MTAKGKVKGNIVVLDEGEKLSDGARVEVGGVEEHFISGRSDQAHLEQSHHQAFRDVGNFAGRLKGAGGAI